MFKRIIGGCAALLLVGGVAFAQAPATQPSGAPMAKSGAMMSSAPKAPLIDLNSAPKADLVALKGIGDKRADDIIKGRPYKGKDELVQKKIIPQGVYDGIKNQIIAKQK